MFAATAQRPWPRVSFDPDRARQAAFTLALIAALVGLTYYPGYSVGSGVLQLPWGFVKFLSDTLVVATQVLGTIGAVILISVVTGTAPRERAAVWMLALAAAAPLVQALLGYGDLYLYPSALVYPAALILIVGALALRRRGGRLFTRSAAPTRRSRRGGHPCGDARDWRRRAGHCRLGRPHAADNDGTRRVPALRGLDAVEAGL